MKHTGTLAPRRTRALAVVTALTLGAGAVALTAPPASAANPATVAAIYGSTSPTYDGVYRQSLAILGLHAAGRTAPAAAITWLLDQQCAGGGFSSFNPDPSADCPAYDGTTYSGGIDSNATAVAAQALLAVGRTSEAARAVEFLADAQQLDGGWEYTSGSGWGTDPNSTALALTALNAAGVEPDVSPLEYFWSLQNGLGLPASEPEDEGGIASPYSNGAPDLLATVQAIPAVGGANLVDVPSPADWASAPTAYPVPPMIKDLPTTADFAAHWLAEQVDADAVGTSNLPWAVLSFATTATAKDQAVLAYERLRAGVLDIGTNPGALGQGALAAAALGETADAGRFANLIEKTLSTGPAAGSYAVSSRSVWSTQKVTLTRSDAGPADQTQVITWGDGTRTVAPGTTRTFSHTYTAASKSAYAVTVDQRDALGSTTRSSLGSVTVTRDTVDPTSAITRPSAPAKASSWRTLRGTAKDTGLGVASVDVRVIERRGSAWYAYTGSGWTKRTSSAAARKAAKQLTLTPTASGAWSVRLTGVTKGLLKPSHRSTDRAGNTASWQTWSVALTKK